MALLATAAAVLLAAALAALAARRRGKEREPMETPQERPGAHPAGREEHTAAPAAGPAGPEAHGPEETHLPEPTIWPFVLAGGLTLVALGLLTNLAFAVAGVALVAVALAGWVREVRRA